MYEYFSALTRVGDVDIIVAVLVVALGIAISVWAVVDSRLNALTTMLLVVGIVGVACIYLAMVLG